MGVRARLAWKAALPNLVQHGRGAAWNRWLPSVATALTNGRPLSAIANAVDGISAVHRLSAMLGARERCADQSDMGWAGWRNIGLALSMPLAIVAGYRAGLGSRDWSGEAIWLLCAALVVFGVAFGLRAILLILVACLMWFTVGSAHSRCVTDCNGGLFLVTLFGALLSIPVVFGAAIGTPLRRRVDALAERQPKP
jgi:hypothetical protein